MIDEGFFYFSLVSVTLTSQLIKELISSNGIYAGSGIMKQLNETVLKAEKVTWKNARHQMKIFFKIFSSIFNFSWFFSCHQETLSGNKYALEIILLWGHWRTSAVLCIIFVNTCLYTHAEEAKMKRQFCYVMTSPFIRQKHR